MRASVAVWCFDVFYCSICNYESATKITLLIKLDVGYSFFYSKIWQLILIKGYLEIVKLMLIMPLITTRARQNLIWFRFDFRLSARLTLMRKHFLAITALEYLRVSWNLGVSLYFMITSAIPGEICNGNVVVLTPDPALTSSLLTENGQAVGVTWIGPTRKVRRMKKLITMVFRCQTWKLEVKLRERNFQQLMYDTMHGLVACIKGSVACSGFISLVRHQTF